MADIVLKSIKFPGLSEPYLIPTTISGLTPILHVVGNSDPVNVIWSSLGNLETKSLDAFQGGYYRIPDFGTCIVKDATTSEELKSVAILENSIYTVLLSGSGGGDTSCEHDYVYQSSPSDPTCGDTVTYSYTCSKCGDVKESGSYTMEHVGYVSYSPINATSHAVVSTCTKCGETLGSSTANHTPDYKQNCQTPMKCALCGYVMDAPSAHTYNSSGVCTVCGAKKS